MKRSSDRILTTHTGSLPRPSDLAGMLDALDTGAATDPAALEARVRRAVADIVRLQVDAAAAEQRLDAFLEHCDSAPARAIKARQATYAGPIEGGAEWLPRWIDAGARHLALRFAGGDQLAQVAEAASRLLPRLNTR